MCYKNKSLIEYQDIDDCLSSKGEKEWEFVNKDKNGDIGFVNWSRVIEDELFIERFKSLVKNKKCLN